MNHLKGINLSNNVIVMANGTSRGGRSIKSVDKLRSQKEMTNWVFDENQLPADSCFGLRHASVWASRYLSRGESKFVAVGGDGTMNALLNGIISACKKHRKPIDQMTIGAVGTGSSNDFHKPFNGKTIHGLPCKIDFNQTRSQDIGQIKNLDTGEARYFLLNCGIGLTANANRYFSSGHRLITRLKKISVDLAIAFTAIKSVLGHTNTPVTIQFDEEEKKNYLLTNLALLKNPHVAGSFKYPSLVGHDDRKLAVFLSHDQSRFRFFKTLLGLLRQSFDESHQALKTTVSKVTIKCDSEIAVECDGEVELGKHFEISILKERINVCL
ncbi:MAG: hypothetical protein HRU19_21875 [Pseudobacteriovorax sp.]|nr:hypothetical protein [Pseudobacteriovorax sp.]